MRGGVHGHESGPAELRHLWNTLRRPRVRHPCLHEGALRFCVPGRLFALWQRLRRYSHRSNELWRVQHRVRHNGGLFGGKMHEHLPRGNHELCGCMRERVRKPLELWPMRPCLPGPSEWWSGLLEWRVRARMRLRLLTLWRYVLETGFEPDPLWGMQHRVPSAGERRRRVLG